VLAEAGDAGVVGSFRRLAETIVTSVAPPVELSGCTARMLDNIEAALGRPGPPA
jgi:hypothetical protein